MSFQPQTLKNKIYTRYSAYCNDKKITPFTQILKYLSSNEERNRLDEEIITISFPGNDTYNFNSRLKCEDLRPIVGSYINYISNLTEINLKFNKIADNGAFIISKLIESAENITLLNLMGNQISDVGCEKLTNSLKSKPNIYYLNFNTNLIGNVGIMHINELLFTNVSLTTLDVGNNYYDWDGLIAITSALKSTNTTLQVLNVDNPQYKLPEQDFFTHFGKMFKDNKGLEKISMSQHKLRFEGISILTYYLTDNDSLQVLNLSGNQICFQGIIFLSDYLEKSHNLKSLILAGNRIKDAGAKYFAKGISKNRSIVHCDLTNNSINDEGLCRIAEGIEVNSSVQSLKLFMNNNWGDESIEMFQRILKDKGTDFYPDFVIYESEFMQTNIAYIETHIPHENKYLV